MKSLEDFPRLALGVLPTPLHRLDNISRLLGKNVFIKRDDLGKSLQGITPGTWTIVLTHDPSHWRREVLHTSDAALTLSGHTHAGQMRLGSLSPARLLYREWAGDYHHQGRMLHVSQGISGTVPFRLGAWPELDIITLKKTT